MPRRRSLILASLLLAACAAPLAAQEVAGRLLEAGTDKPVAAGQVMLLGEAGQMVAWANTDTEGRFRLAAPGPGAYLLLAKRIGYEPRLEGPIELAATDPLEVEFRIQSRALSLDSVTVTAEPQRMTLATTGFYQRREREQGHFMDREQIERRSPVRSTDLMRSIPGVRLVATGAFAGTGPTQQIQMRGFGAGQGPCVPRIYIDGMQIHAADTDLDDIIIPQHIEAVEVYRGSAEVPIQYGGAMGACGVILIWSKRS